VADPAFGELTFARLAQLIGPLLRFDCQVAVTPRAQLVADLHMDSLDVASLACEIEEAFALEIPDDDVASWYTLAQVAATVDRLLAARFAEALRDAREQAVMAVLPVGAN
jgi:acyl carrier protein